MIRISYADLERHLSRYLDEAVDASITVVVTCPAGKGSVVIIAEAVFDGWRETVHLLSRPKNAKRLIRGVRQAEAGQLKAPDLLP